MSNKIKDITDRDFEEISSGKRGVHFIDIWAEWCGPCRQLSEVVKELAEDYGSMVEICKMDADKNQQTMMKLGIRGIPTVLLVKDGKVVQTLVGLQSRSTYEQAIEKALKS